MPSKKELEAEVEKWKRQYSRAAFLRDRLYGNLVCQGRAGFAIDVLTRAAKEWDENNA